MPENFRRTKEGDNLIRQVMEELRELEEQKYGDKSIFQKDDQNVLRVHLLDLKESEKPPSWNDLLVRGPALVSQLFAKIRSRDEYGKVAHGFFKQMTSHLQSEHPRRAEFMKFM